FLIPETSDTEWKWNEFVERVNKDLIGNFGNFINRTLSFVKNYFGGKISHNECNFNDREREIIEEVRKKIEEYKNLMINLNLRDGLKKILEISDLGNKFFQESEIWKNKRKEALYICILISYYLAIIIHPFLPNASKKIFKMLNINKNFDIQEIYVEKIEFHVDKVDILFEKLTKEKIEKIKDIVTKTGEKVDVDVEEKEKENFVEYEDFAKLKFVVGKVLDAEEIPNSEKLLKLVVDIGTEKRQIIAGIKQFYKPEEIINKKVIVLKNLKPKKIAGVLSEGMVLAADDNGEIKILTVEKDAREGSEIK
ncbi:MAG: methionine--tRNA ligase subunit beta, partial [Candidatus Altarchaeaceae archaeon]